MKEMEKVSINFLLLNLNVKLNIDLIAFAERQTWTNERLRTINTFLQQPTFWGPIFNFDNLNLLELQPQI